MCCLIFLKCLRVDGSFIEISEIFLHDVFTVFVKSILHLYVVYIPLKYSFPLIVAAFILKMKF